MEENMIDIADEQPGGTIRRGNKIDIYALPDGAMSSVEHFKMMVRRVQNDAKFREGLEEYAKAKREANRSAGVADEDSGVPIWLVAARSPEKYREVIDRLEYVCYWIGEKMKRRMKAESMPLNVEMNKQVSADAEKG